MKSPLPKGVATQLTHTHIYKHTSQLHLSILSKMTKAITNIIRLAPHRILLDLLNDDGQCGMHFAVLTSQPQVIRQLRAAGAKVSTHNLCNTPCVCVRFLYYGACVSVCEV